MVKSTNAIGSAAASHTSTSEGSSWHKIYDAATSGDMYYGIAYLSPTSGHKGKAGAGATDDQAEYVAAKDEA